MAGLKNAADLRPFVVSALSRGWQTIPHTNIGGELVADGLVSARAGLPAGPQRITYTDLLLVAVGRMAERPVAREGLVGSGRRIWANACLDHRAADGEAGGRLLAALERRIAELPAG